MEWVTKKLVAALVNRWFGHFIEDASSQEINDALLSGQVDLTNVRVRKDALCFLEGLYETSLPIEVHQGVIGRISLTVPYSSIFTQPLIVTVQDVLLLVSPIVEYDTEEEKKKERRRRRSFLQQLFQEMVAKDSEGAQVGLLGLLYNRIWNNLQLRVNDVHIRYEDTTSLDSPLVIGFCLQSLSAETTNHKWKKIPPECSSYTVSKVLEVVSASVYVNSNCDKQRLVKQHAASDRWREFLLQGLNSFCINEEQFRFVVSPIRCKIKMRQHLQKEARVPGLLVDAIIKEIVNISLDRDQYVALLKLSSSFADTVLNKRFRKYRPEAPLKRHAREWWQYLYQSVLYEFIRPFSWESISLYRKVYRDYVQLCKRLLVEKKNLELEADVLALEDKLNMESIVTGRMHAKINLSSEDPATLKPVLNVSCGWFSWLRGGNSGAKEEEEATFVDVVATQRPNQFLSAMSSEERKVLLQELSALNERATDSRHKEDIDQKIYLSFRELTVTLRDEEFKDIGLCIVTGLVFSLENRFGVRYQKVSFKMESVNVEAANIEDDLVHVLKLVEGTSTIGYGVALSCDFEINPMSGSEDYGLVFKIDPVELIYHQEALSRLVNFFCMDHFQQVKSVCENSFLRFLIMAKNVMNLVLHRKLLIHLDVDIKSPYIILPEYGSIQKGGNVLVVDFGGFRVTTELGGSVSNPEEATQMELEEKLYDHLSIEIAHLQVIFADSGDEWRVMRARDDSDLHLLPRIRVKINFANNVYPQLKEHPQQKLDIHLTPLKLNMSDNRINHLIEFFQHFPLLILHNEDGDEGHSDNVIKEPTTVPRNPELRLKSANILELAHVRKFLHQKLLSHDTSSTHSESVITPEFLKHVKTLRSFDTVSQTSLELAKYFPDESDEEGESLSKPVDLLGYEGNTSPTNMVKILSRFCIDEVILCISRSTDHGERPYLMIKVTRFLIESALMNYGPSIQMTIGSLHLVDKYHHCSSGEYLELLSSDQSGNVLAILYRKVRADCPDFKSHFHSCEQSFVVDVSTVNFIWQRTSILTLSNFITNLPSKLEGLWGCQPFIYDFALRVKRQYLSDNDDPPVPSGATKWSASISVSNITLKFCDNEVDYIHAKLSGFHSGCVFKANEKVIFRASLSDLLLEDFSDITLYTRIMEVEEDRVFEVKFVKFSPFVSDLSDSNPGEINCKSDVSVSIQFGRLQCVLLYKVLSDIDRFLESIISTESFLNFASMVHTKLKVQFHSRFARSKISLGICIHTPTLLVPQKSDSPCLLVFNFGDFKVDNFFKPAPGSASSFGLIENILLEVGPVEICRAVMTLGGGLELQEAILEPSTVRIDLKRSLMRQCRDVLSYDVTISVDGLFINLGQRDLNTILGVLTQNKSEAYFPESPISSRPFTPAENGTTVTLDDNVGKLQAFLTRSVDIYRISVCVIFIENIKLTLYTDMNEVLSSPVRDAATALCKLEIGEIEVHGDMNNDKSLELGTTVKSCDIYDVRVDSNNFVKKIFGHSSGLEPIIHGGFKFNQPPLLEVMVKISPNGDLNTEIALDKVRLNISEGFILAFYKYINNAIPGAVNTPGEIFNPSGFAAEETGVHAEFGVTVQKPPSYSDSTSGYLSTGISNTDEQKVISVSFRAKLPEIVLFVDPEESRSRIVVLRFHIQSDYSKHPGNESFKLNLDKIVLFTSLYTREKQQPYVIIAPWYFEGTWQMKNSEEGETITIQTSDICVNICSHVVHMLNGLAEEVFESLDPYSCIELNLPLCDSEDLWSPKPLMATHINSDLNNDNLPNQSLSSRKCKQKMTFRCPNIKIYFEKGLCGSTFPVFALDSAVDVEVNDWNKAMYMRTSIHISILHLNEEFFVWEYVLDPVREGESTVPLELKIRAVQHTARPIGSRNDQKLRRHDSIDTWSHSDKCSHKEVFANEESPSSSDEDDNRNNEMVILKPSSQGKQGSLRKGVASIPSISRYSLESDSETEGNLLYQISSTFSHMFSSGSENSGELTEDADLSEDENEEGEDVEGQDQDEDQQETEEKKKVPDGVIFSVSGEGDHTHPVFPEESRVTVRDCDLSESRYPMATSVIVSCKDPVEFSLSPTIMKAVCDLADEYSQVKSSARLPISSFKVREYKLTNEIGPNSKVSLLSSNDLDNPADVRLLAEAKFREPSSTPSSPHGSLEDSSQASSSEEDASHHMLSDWDNLNLSLNFSPAEFPYQVPSMDSAFAVQVPDSVKLYEDITKHRVSIEVAGFESLEVFVGARSQNRMFQLRHSASDCRYHVFVLVEISHDLVDIVVRSPLQVMNDLPLPMNICFKKSALQNLSMERRETGAASPSHSIASLSSLSNPFEEHPPMITLQPDQTFTVPLSVAYHSPIFVVPSATDYGVSEGGFWWREVEASSGAKVLTCLPRSGDGSPISVTCLPSKGLSLPSAPTEEAGVASTVVPNFLLRLTAPVQVFNHLPFTLVLHYHPLPLALTLDPGGSTSITRIDPHKDEELDVQISNYQGSDWKAILRIPVDRSDYPRTLTLMRVEGRAKGRLEVSLYVSRSASISIFIYAPYWIVNKTGLPLQLRASRSKVTTESSGGEEILLFRYKKTLPHKLKIRVLESEWSRGWSCDAVGTCGVVICEDKLRNKKFRILARVSLSTLKASLPSERRKGSPKGVFHPTKIVTLMPYFLVKNSTCKAIMYMQESDKNGLWFDIGPNQCEPFWPDSDDMYLVVRRRDSQVISQRFHFNSVHKTVLRMEKGRALVVIVEGVGTDSPVIVCFLTYSCGDAPVRLENWCDDVFLRFHQRGSNQVTLLAPRQSILYTWDDPTLQRDLLWNIYSRKNEDFTAVINMDKHGTERVTVTSLKAKTAMRTQSQSNMVTQKVRPKTTQRQRARTTPSTSSTEEDDEVAEGWLLVGKDSKGLTVAQRNTRLHGTQRDKMVVHWVCHKQRNQRVLLFTQSDRLAHLTRMPDEKADLELFISLERVALSVINGQKKEAIYGGVFPSTAIWQIEVDGVWKEPQSLELCAWLEDQYLYNKNRQVNLKGSLQIDFAKMRMTAPFIGRLRRLKHPALWVHYRQSSHVSYCRTKIQSVQVDNQQEDAIFPTVLSSNRDKVCDKPSVDICLILHSSFKQTKTVRHLDCITQDLNLNFDKGFVSSIYDLTRPLVATIKTRNIHSELKTLLTPLTFATIKQSERVDTSYPVERVCLGGVRFNVSLSPKGLPSSSEKTPDLLDGLLASLGVAMGEIQNVGINVSQFEMVAVTWNQVMRDIKNHFKHQILQQIYVLMLGLNILGNPYQRLRDLTQGVQDLVYDSQTGVIDRPDDFAEEFSNECYSVCGHTSREDASVLRILDSIIDCSISRIWFSDNRKVPRFSVVLSSAEQDWSRLHWFSPVGLVWHFVGMMSDPYTGTSQESIESFLRSRGKSLVGLISNTTFGVNHQIAMATDGIRRAILVGYEAYLRERSARHVSPYSAMKPTNPHESEGLALFSSIPQTSLIHSDIYFAHVRLSNTRHPPIFLATTRHFYFLETHGNWGLCEVVWLISIWNLMRQPIRTEDTITFQLRQDESQSHLSGAVRLLQCSDPNILDFVMHIVTFLMTLQMEELPCPVLSKKNE